MPRRITPHHPPVPPPLTAARTVQGADHAATDLAFEVAQVVEEWTTSAEHSEQTRMRMSETVTRFARHASARGVRRLAEVQPCDARTFITALTRHGQEPELATQHARRTALRTLYRTARQLDLATGDPTLDIALPARGSLAARPLSDDEVTLCRASTRASRGPRASLRATAWALGEATAISSEITQIRIRDLDDPHHPSHVQLPGTRRHDPRRVALTTWGSIILGERSSALLPLYGPDTLLAYGGHAPPGEAKAQASVCNALRHVLGTARLLAEADIRPASLRHWVGRSAYDAGTPLEEVARLLGLHSLDATAEDIALDWRRKPVDTSPVSGRRAPEEPVNAATAPTNTCPYRHLSLAPLQEDPK